MEKFLIRFRVFLEALFLWFGGLGLFWMASVFIHPHIEQRFGIRGGDVFYAATIIILAAAAIWITAARRREMGERISASAYIILTFIPLPLMGALIYIFISSLD